MLLARIWYGRPAMAVFGVFARTERLGEVDHLVGRKHAQRLQLGDRDPPRIGGRQLSVRPSRRIARGVADRFALNLLPRAVIFDIVLCQ